MNQQLRDRCGNTILRVETFINWTMGFAGFEHNFIDCKSDVDVYFYTNKYDTLSPTEKASFKLAISDGQKIPEIVTERKTKNDTSETEQNRITGIIRQYLNQVAEDFNLVYFEESEYYDYIN